MSTIIKRIISSQLFLMKCTKEFKKCKYQLYKKPNFGNFGVLEHTGAFLYYAKKESTSAVKTSKKQSGKGHKAIS